LTNHPFITHRLQTKDGVKMHPNRRLNSFDCQQNKAKVNSIKMTCDVSTRRTFIFTCAGAAMALGLAPMTTIHASAGVYGTFRPLGNLDYVTLAGQVNTQFQVRLASGQTISLKLLKAPLARPTSIMPGRRLSGDSGNEKFSLIFSGSKDHLLEPAIHQFEHGHLGRFEMYIGQIGTCDPDAVRYETVFNRPTASV
jgi:hypothetical protein